VCVKNNAASVWNRTGQTVRVYFNSNFAGASQDFASGAKGNLNATLKNNNASHELLASQPTGCRTDGTNTKLPTTILVYRVGLGQVDRVAFDAQRQHPDGALLLDDDRLQCLGGRRLDVAVRLT
jgi:hypothetical protein